MKQGKYVLTMLGSTIGATILANALPELAIVICILGIVISIAATVGRAKDAGVNPTLWAFLVFIPIAWIVLACKPSKLFFAPAE
jgi:hypothetical protein